MDRFDAPYAEADEAVVPRLAEIAHVPQGTQARIDATATKLIEGIRRHSTGVGSLEDFLREYGLSTKEGLALMAMAEALLRVPDAATQDKLIADKIGGSEWTKESDSWLVSAATWGLGVSNRIVRPGDTPGGLLRGAIKRVGAPAVRQGVREAMRYLGHQFVLGRDIDEALKRARPQQNRGYLYSYDMLGEGARTWPDARRYAASYAHAIDAIGRAAGNRPLPDRPGISVKLSALHPRFEARRAALVVPEIVPVLRDLARAARRYDLSFTVDAEEARRLEISLDVIAEVFADPELRGWDGFGLAVQAYAKRALAVIDWTAELARAHDARIMVRLVKGAYWDTEIKESQAGGSKDFPVFTRKPATDVSYAACAARLLEHRPTLYPQFATHNALTVATILERAGGADGFEVQRLHGMGEALHGLLVEGAAAPPVRSRIYAPVGGHKELLAYLVRRLLENGANSSFVARVGDPKVPVADLLERPEEALSSGPRHPRIPLPPELFPGRRNSAGVELGSRAELGALLGEMAPHLRPVTAPPGTTADEADAAMAAAARAQPAWDALGADARGRALETAADMLEAERGRLLALIAREAGRTIDDGVDELREAVDFLRFYAAEARRLTEPTRLPGPAGEENVHRLRGRGVIVAIAPWNFPLAIFLGQAAAALAAGNAVVAKPAPQTPAIGKAAVEILHRAGVPRDVLGLAVGGAEVAQRLLGHPALSGVAFTGSDATAKAIHRQLAGRDGPILPLVAETGGINAMVVDATALPEQVADDVVASAFRSAGQRCSACRILYLQEDVAEGMLETIRGLAETLRIGDPADPATDIGPVIDAAAHARLAEHVEAHRSSLRWQGEAPDGGTFMAPAIVELPEGARLEREVFGPVLHVKRYAASELDAVLAEVEATGYGLTFALHSRIESTVKHVLSRVRAGNLYVNRNQIGAVVGSQPFGGRGRSGTGPKAGGPLYLQRFCEEVTVSINTAAAGGNASLIAMEDG
jgi:RHH-type proline utilization regulon transcriptional repressor/proline dehydrogenase/delta 1-pyrroline-5-carboxylate dehydrogenase